MATIRQVASLAQVSPGTVSQLLSGSASVRPETRKRIEYAIDHLGYRRRPAGRPSTANPRHHIGLLICEQNVHANADRLAHPVNRRRYNHLRDTLLANGDQLSLLAGNMHVDQNWAFADAIQSGHIDGIVIGGYDNDRGYVDWLNEKGVPYVVLERAAKMNAFSSVCVDSVMGGRLAAEHMLECGATRFAYVSHSRRALSWIAERSHGFASTLQAHGHEPLTCEFDPDNAQPDIHNICRKLVEQKVDGIFASSDGMAILLVNELEQIGKIVPDDIAIVGFDDMEVTSKSGLRPTSIAYDHAYLAQTTVRLLKQLITDPLVSTLSAHIRPTLAKHDTTAPLCKSKRTKPTDTA